MRYEQHAARERTQRIGKLELNFPLDVLIKRGKRLVEQQDFGFSDQNAGERNALLLTARKIRREALRQLLQPERAQDALCGGLPLCARTLARSGANILLDRHVREQGILLKQVTDAALLRRQVDMLLAVEQRAAVQHDPAPVRAHDTGDAAQRHALAAAGRAEQRHGLVFRLERHAQVERAEIFLDIDRNTHAAAPFPRFSSRLTASSTTAEIARLTATQKNACRSSFVRQS